MKKLLIGLLVLGLTGCATVDVAKPTPSGNAERIFVGATKDELKTALVARCLEKGNAIYESNDFSLACGRIDDSFGASLGQLLTTGNNNYSPVLKKIVFSFHEIKDGVKVFAIANVEMTNRNGTKQITPVKSNNVTNQIQSILDSIEIVK